MKSLIVKKNKFKTNKKKLQTVKHKHKHTKTQKKHIGGASVSAIASADTDGNAIIFHEYLSKHKITYGDELDTELEKNVLNNTYIQRPEIPLMYSDHAPILYTVDTHQIIVWNIGQWGCLYYTEPEKTYNHKFNMNRRETFGEYIQRLKNIIDVLNTFVSTYPNAIFCLQEIPNMFINFNTDNKNITFNDPYKIKALFDKYIIEPVQTNTLHSQMLDVQTMFYTQLEDNFIYNKNIDKNSSNVLIMYGKYKQLTYNKPFFLNIYNKYEPLNTFIFSNNRADGFYMIKDATELIVFISVHMFYPFDDKNKNKNKNANIIMDIFKAIINIIDKIQKILQITVYMCGDFNISSKQHYINMESPNIFKKVEDLFLKKQIMIKPITSSMHGPTIANSSLKDNFGGITEETIDYINKFNITINKQTFTSKLSAHASIFKPTTPTPTTTLHRQPTINSMYLNESVQNPPFNSSSPYSQKHYSLAYRPQYHHPPYPPPLSSQFSQRV